MNELTLLSPAKVNLSLQVIRKRSDGYHDILSVLQKVSLYDEITLAISPSPGISVTTDNPSIPADSQNLAYRAAHLIVEHQHISAGVSIHIRKKIPVGAGLGGGSSNAATTLRGVNRLLQCTVSNEELQRMGLELGADVPFFLYDHATACAEGIGEILSPINLEVPIWFIIVFPGFSVSTAWAYRNYKILTNMSKHTKLQNSFNSFKCIPSLLKNDLEHAVIPRYPEIRKIKEFLVKAGASGSLMSGSGSSVFGIFPEEELARKAVSVLSLTEEHKAFIVHSI